MAQSRLAPIALMALASASGCAASRVGQAPPRVLTERPAPASPDISEMVYRHNRNAEQVTSVEAVPSVAISSRLRGGGSTTGKMVFERPHNFRFVVNRTGMSTGRMADIGSNDDEFWFWSGIDKDNSDVYVASYEAPTASGGYDLPFQPDWIVEALGLREIPPEEEHGIRTSAGPEPGTIAWTHHRTSLRGEPIQKVTILREDTGEIVEHRFYNAGSRIAAATARPSQVKPVATDVNPNLKVRIPQKIHLVLAALEPKQSPVVMDLNLSDLRINAEIAQARRDDLFAVPQIAGSEIVRLSEIDAPGRDTQALAPRRDSRTRQSLPAPPTGVRLGEPAPLKADDAYLKRSDPMPIDADDLGANANPEGMEGVVGTNLPRGSSPAPVARYARREVSP